MLRRLFIVCLAAGFAASASAQTVSKDPSRAPSGAYKIDSAHTLILFSLLHLDLTEYVGRIDRISGTLNFDANEPEKSSTDITADMDSIDTPSGRLNDDLKGPGVFDTAQFPTTTFKSTSLTRTGPDTGRMTGDLTIKGITKPVVFDVVFHGGAASPINGDYMLGFHASTVIKRTDFGLTGMIWNSFVGNDVTLTIEAAFDHAKD